MADDDSAPHRWTRQVHTGNRKRGVDPTREPYARCRGCGLRRVIHGGKVYFYASDGKALGHREPVGGCSLQW